MAYFIPYLESFDEITDIEEIKKVVDIFDLQVLRNELPTNYKLYKKEMNIFPDVISNVYNIRIETRDFKINDIVKINCNNANKFEYVDSDEIGIMIDSHDKNNYFAIVGYDSEYDGHHKEFYGQDKHSFGIYDTTNKSFEYIIVEDPKKHLDFMLKHIINVWIIYIDMSQLKNISYDEISEKVCILLT